ncbi:unnamed protein product [Clavelina lepadiformis]|uniref:Ubiquinol-cytochrome C reductase hinge domain-containing protein n=1 Tax=Clavelina lepadiformis TaxID=159417 RepID=A0ABP0FN34_CLALP
MKHLALSVLKMGFASLCCKELVPVNTSCTSQDPMDEVKELCNNSSACKGYRVELDSCTDRVSSRSQTEEHCTQELFDFLHCSDKCVANKLFSNIK